MKIVKENKQLMKIGLTIAVVIISAVIFSFSFRIFINNKDFITVDENGVEKSTAFLLSSGVSGISLIISRLIFENNITSQNTLVSILYLSINIPLFVIGFLYIGKKFTLYSLIHVVVVSLCTELIPQETIHYLLEKANMDLMTIDPLALSIFAGILSGISTGLVFKFNASGGGMDIVVLYLAIKKGINSGHYMRIINITIIVIGGIALHQVPSSLYTIIYIFTSALIIDAIHIRNKKAVLNVITSLGEEVSEALLASSRHSCTIFEGKGAYSKKNREMLYMVISSFEIEKMMKIIKSVDPNSFISVTTANFVSGRFYVPPLE